jgi:hypothetical protein
MQTRTMRPVSCAPFPAPARPIHEAGSRTRHGWAACFSVRSVLCVYVGRKKLTTSQIEPNIDGMDPIKKKEYYRSNIEKRRAYQREYYTRNAQLIKRKREVNEHLSPEVLEKRKQYNKEYYKKNRERIRQNRAKHDFSKKSCTDRLSDDPR